MHRLAVRSGCNAPCTFARKGAEVEKEMNNGEHVIEIRLQFKFSDANPVDSLNDVKAKLANGVLPPIELCIGGAVRLLIREDVSIAGKEFKSWIEIPEDAEFEEVQCEDGDGSARRFVIIAPEPVAEQEEYPSSAEDQENCWRTPDWYRVSGRRLKV